MEFLAEQQKVKVRYGTGLGLAMTVVVTEPSRSVGYAGADQIVVEKHQGKIIYYCVF